MNDKIEVLGARVHNLKNVDVTMPRNSLIVFTGLSGSGKSSLAFDTIFAEGQRRYIETFSAYARNFLGGMERLMWIRLQDFRLLFLSNKRQPTRIHVLRLARPQKFTIICVCFMLGRVLLTLI